jgi:hypothetical protein
MKDVKGSGKSEKYISLDEFQAMLQGLDPQHEMSDYQNGIMTYSLFGGNAEIKIAIVDLGNGPEHGEIDYMNVKETGIIVSEEAHDIGFELKRAGRHDSYLAIRWKIELEKARQLLTEAGKLLGYPFK